MLSRTFISFALIFLLISCGEDSSNGPKNGNGGTEIPCTAANEGMIVKPADSEDERLCKDGAWVNIPVSSSSAEFPNNSSSSTIEVTEPSSSSQTIKNEDSSSSLSSSSQTIKDEKSSSSVEPSSSSVKESQSSSSETISSSSSEELVESSSSDETKMFLCDDGVTYVLDLANCEKISSSSVAESSSSSLSESSSSEEKESSSSLESSSSFEESSDSEISSSSEENSSSSFSSSSWNSAYDAENNTLTDFRDGNVYKTVTIGNQVWMAENLNYLPENIPSKCYEASPGPSVCGGGKAYTLEEGDCSVYGRLYESRISSLSASFGCSMDICPDGWRIPSQNQWKTLFDFLGGVRSAGRKIKAKGFWRDETLTDPVGFSALPAGIYDVYDGFNWRSDSLLAVFAVRSYPDNSIWLYASADSVLFGLTTERFYFAYRCIKN